MYNSKCSHYFLCEIIILVFSLKSCSSLEKHWLPNLEWETANNWMNNRVPEIDSHVVFPLETRHAVGVGKFSNMRLSEVDLPRFGSLVLAKEGKLELTESKQSGVKISRWMKEGPLFWSDPENWNGSSEAAPHLEQLPCRQDDAVLPETKHTLSVLLPMKEIQVKSIRMSDHKHPFTQWQWEDFQDQREFTRGRFTVKYSEYNCEKCPCQDDLYGDYLREICAIQRPRCGFTACEYPLKVEGHCCRYCGGRVSLSKKASLPIVKIAVNDALQGYEEKVTWHVRQTWKGAAEVLIKRKGEYSNVDVEDAIDSVKAALMNTGIEVVSAESAGAALQDNRLAFALGPLFGTPLVIIAFLLLGFAYFGYSFEYILSGCGEAFTSVRNGIRANRQQSRKPFSFARFENFPEGNIEIAGVAGINEQRAEDEDDGGSPSGGRFENPLYRSKRKKEEKTKMLDVDAPLSLATLKDKVEDHMEEVEMNIDQ